MSNLAQLVSRNARRSPDGECLVQPEPERRSLNWAELDAQVDAVAAGFAASSTGSAGGSGLVAGQRVGLCGPNSIEYLVAYLAILRAGLVAVPIDPQLEEDEVQHASDEAGISLLLGGNGHALSREGLEAWAQHGHSPVLSPPDSEALAVLLRTAGTSGEPRLAMLSHRALLAQVSHSWFSEVIEQDATLLGALPFAHVFGLGAAVGSWLGTGARLVVAESASEHLSEVISEEAVDQLPLTPTMLFRLLREPDLGDQLRRVQRVLVAGAPVPDRLAQEFSDRTGLRVERGYGLTEAASGVSATIGGPVLGPNHVGRPLPGVEVRIGDGLDAGEPGPIALRGDNLFSGYWPDGSGGPDSDGWFVTDDLGYFSESELFVVDRSDEVIVVHGFSVYPTEVEQVIRELPRVSGVAVVGTADTNRGERNRTRIVAFVSGQELSGAQVAEHCRSRLAPYKRPAEIRLLTSLPQGITGEVRRGALRRILRDEQLSVSGVGR